MLLDDESWSELPVLDGEDGGGGLSLPVAVGFAAGGVDVVLSPPAETHQESILPYRKRLVRRK